MKLSFSSISTYKTCPFQYKLIYIERLPRKKTPALSFGSSLHAALAFLYDVKLPQPPSLEATLSCLEENWEREGYSNEAEEQAYFDHAKRVLAKYYHQNIIESSSFDLPVALEHNFSIELDGCALTGVIDRVDKLPDGGYEVIDYKTSRRLPPKSRINQDLQLSIYHLATEKIWGISPKKLSLYFLLPNKKMSTTRSEADVKKTKALIENTLEEITKEKFEPRENALCPWCDFQYLCPFYKHKFQQKNKKTSIIPKPTSGEESPEIEKVVNEFLHLKKEAKKIQKQIEKLGAIIHQYCQENNVSRLFSEFAQISRYSRERYSYDKDRLKEILQPLGLFEQILRVDGKEVEKLLKSNYLEENAKKLIETAKKTEETIHNLYVKEIKRDKEKVN